MNVTIIPVKAKCVPGAGVKVAFFSALLSIFGTWWRLIFFPQHKKSIMKASARARGGRTNEIFHQETLHETLYLGPFLLKYVQSPKNW